MSSRLVCSLGVALAALAVPLTSACNSAVPGCTNADEPGCGGTADTDDTTTDGATDPTTTDATDATAGTDDGTTTGTGTGTDTDSDTDTDSATDTETGVDDTFGPGPWDHGVEIPDEPQLPGDPEAGYEALLTRGYVSCGVPYGMFQLAKGLLGAYTDGEPLPGRTGKNAQVPFNWTVHSETESGTEVAALNCLTCHAGYFNGELVVGLGRADGDFTDDMGALVNAVPIPDLPLPGLSEMKKMQDRYAAIGPYIQMYTVGSNPADMIAVLLSSHRDQDTLHWSQEPLFPVPEAIAPVDVPPWWRAGKKHSLFHNGMARGDKRGTMMFASSLCTDTVAEAEKIMSYFNDINAYISSLAAPAYPFAIDAALADAGEPVFVNNCAGCHGLYAEDDADDWYPNLILPLDIIATDAVEAEYAVNEASKMVDWYNGSYYGTLTRLETDNPFPGYVAPPLDGIWATAPFFHNGSVPTIEAVLNSKARPTYWKRVDYNSANFDEDSLGWPYVETQYGQDGAPADERKYIYDTTLFAHTNVGHPFGDHLTPEERRAVIEYLKTL